jgi:hypothetical protein
LKDNYIIWYIEKDTTTRKTAENQLLTSTARGSSSNFISAIRKNYTDDSSNPSTNEGSSVGSDNHASAVNGLVITPADTIARLLEEPLAASLLDSPLHKDQHSSQA